MKARKTIALARQFEFKVWNAMKTPNFSSEVANDLHWNIWDTLYSKLLIKIIKKAIANET